MRDTLARWWRQFLGLVRRWRNRALRYVRLWGRRAVRFVRWAYPRLARNALVFGGIAGIGYGAWLWFEPAGYIAAGALVLLIGVWGVPVLDTGEGN